MLYLLMKQVATRARPAHRRHSSHTKLWDLFRAPEPPTESEGPRYIMNMKDNLSFALERMRLLHGPVALQLLDRNARRVVKTNSSKRLCSYRRRRQKRLVQRSDK